MLSITIEEVIPIWLAIQLTPAARDKIDLVFEKTAKKIDRVFAQWRAEFADEQAEKKRWERASFTEKVRLSAERAARRAPKEDRWDVLVGCAIQGWFPVHEALCDLSVTEYGRHDIRTLSRQALEQIARIIDRDLHLGRNVPLAEMWRKPRLIDPVSGTLTPGAMATVEKHRLWIKGQKMWRAIAERHAAQPPVQELEKTAPVPAAQGETAPSPDPDVRAQKPSPADVLRKPGKSGRPVEVLRRRIEAVWPGLKARLGHKPEPHEVAAAVYPEFESTVGKERAKMRDRCGRAIERARLK